MRRHHVTLSDPVSVAVEAQVAQGRYNDISAALQDAAWNFFIGSPSPFEEYGVSAEEVERSARTDLRRIEKARQQGTLKPWKP